MNTASHKSIRLLSFLPYILLFVLATFYLYWFTGYIFFYQEKAALFLTTFSYLTEHFDQPGGFLQYLGKLQTTFYYYPLVGAILISSVTVGIVYLTRKIAKQLTGRDFYFIPFLIGGLLFYLQTNYQYSATNNLGVLLQLTIFYLMTRYLRGKIEWLVPVLFPLNYFLFGSFSAVFLIAITLHYSQKSNWIKIIATWLVGFLFFYLGKEMLFFQTTETLLVFPYSASEVGLQMREFIAIILLVSLIPLLVKIRVRQVSELSILKVRFIEVTPVIVIVLLVVLSLYRIDKKNSHFFHVEKLFYNQKYDELVEFNKNFPTTNMLTLFLNNVALAETGKLSESFFGFPQSQDGGTLFLKWEIVSEVLKRGGYFYYSIGMINEAQRWAYEYMVMNGYTPESLKLMIKTDLIKGKYNLAEKYISILDKSIFYRKDADEFRAFLNDKNALDKHPELGLKKMLDTRQEFFVQAENPSINLIPILNADSLNSYAIEYKLAWLMLQKDMKGIVAMLPMMEKAGYTRIPKNVEEAVVTYKLLNVGPMPELEILRINPQTEQRFQQYYRIYQQNQNNKQMARRALSRDFSDTYWFYVFFS